MNGGIFFALDRCAGIAFGTALIVLPFVLASGYNQFASSKSSNVLIGRSVFRRNLLIFVISVALAFLFSFLLITHARSEVLGKVDPTVNPKVLRAGKQVSTPEPLLIALRAMKPDFFNRSHPTTRLSIDIQSSIGSEHLELAQDSVRMNEYWVFVPKYWVTSTRELGRIQLTPEAVDAIR